MKKKTGVLITVFVVAFSALVYSSSFASDDKEKTKDGVREHFMDRDAYDKLPKEKKELIDEEVQRTLDARLGKIKQADKNEKPDKQDKQKKSPIYVDSGIEAGEAPPGIHDMTVNNIWGGTIDNINIRLYAGNDFEDNKGVVFIDVYDIDGNKLQFQKVYPSQKTGSLTIEKANKEVITLKDSSGNKLYFNAMTLNFDN